MVYILIILGIVLLEMKIKSKIEQKNERYYKKSILGGHVTLEKYHNDGICLSFLKNKKKMILIICGTVLGFVMIAFALLLPKKGHRLLKLGMAFAIGGGISNYLDRLQLGYVVDYFSFKKLKSIVFNLADMFIFLGAILAFFSSLCGKGKCN